MRVETKEPSIHQSISAESGNPEGAGQTPTQLRNPGRTPTNRMGGCNGEAPEGTSGAFPASDGAWRMVTSGDAIGPDVSAISDASERSPRRRARPTFGETNPHTEDVQRDLEKDCRETSARKNDSLIAGFHASHADSMSQFRQAHGQRVCEMKRITAAPHALGNLSENQADLIKKACMFAVGAQ